MDDRTLLEKAAKAAGIDGPLWEMYPGQWCIDIRASEPNGAPAIWNPLADDGDALRLAVKLRMEITYDTQRFNLYVPIHAAYVLAISAGQAEGAMEPLGEDAPKAIRRAIVRAAAAMAE